MSARIELVATSDPYTKLQPGATGTKVGEYVDPWGALTIMVKWDSGSDLSLISGEDAWRELPAEADA